MKKLILTLLAVMLSTELTHPISSGAVAALTFIPLAIVTGVIVYKNEEHKRKYSEEIETKQLIINDLKKQKKEKKEQKLQLRRLESHNQKNSIEATRHRSKIQDIESTIEDLEDRIEALS